MARLTLQSNANSNLDNIEATLERDDTALLNLPAAPPARSPDTTDPLETLLAVHEPRIRRLAHRLLGWRDADADDIVQDVFLAAWGNHHRIRGEASLSTWLTAVTLNRCRTHRRRRLLRLGWLREWYNAPTATDASGGAERDETNARVRSAVASLNAKDREVIVLFYLEELPVAEIAKLLNTSENNVGVRLHRARQRLKEKLQEMNG